MKNELKLNVDGQQDAIKHLKEYCDIDDIETPSKIRLYVKHVINHLHEKNGWQNIFKKSTKSSCDIIVVKCLNKEEK